MPEGGRPEMPDIGEFLRNYAEMVRQTEEHEEDVLRAANEVEFRRQVRSYFREILPDCMRSIYRAIIDGERKFHGSAELRNYSDYHKEAGTRAAEMAIALLPRGFTAETGFYEVCSENGGFFVTVDGTF